MDIVFSINNNAEIMVLPVSPEWEISEDQDIDPQAYIDFFRRIKAERIPARVVITDKQSVERLNMAVSIDSFTYKYMANGDADFSLSMTEYIFL